MKKKTKEILNNAAKIISAAATFCAPWTLVAKLGAFIDAVRKK